MRVTSKGQVTIPAAIREQAGMMPETEVAFEFDGTVVTLRKAGHRKPGAGTQVGRPGRRRQQRIDLTPSEIMALTRGERLVRHLRGKGDIPLSTDEIMAMTRGE